MRILCFATQGHAHIEGERIRGLLEPLHPDVYPFDRASKKRSAIGLVRAVRAQRPRLIVMEGTGTAGGLTLIAIAIGGSAAGIYVANEVRVGSLYRAVPQDQFDTRIRRLFFDLQTAWNGIPDR